MTTVPQLDVVSNTCCSHNRDELFSGLYFVSTFVGVDITIIAITPITSKKLSVTLVISTFTRIYVAIPAMNSSSARVSK